MASEKREIEMNIFSNKQQEREVTITDKIEIGQRVVRGVDWEKGDKDGGEGNVGTVVEILNNSQQVRVQWDSQDTLNRDTCVYRTGLERKYDLRLFDNAQTGVHHKFFECDNCNALPIRGMRWRCLYCKDHDLCTNCYMNDSHNLDHAFERYQGMKKMSVNVGTRTDSRELQTSGVFPLCDVKYRKDTKVAGTLIGIDDITFAEPERVKYFQDHLQEISKVNAAIGIRVVERSDNEHVTVGTITSVKEIKTEEIVLKGGRPLGSQSNRDPSLEEQGSSNPNQKMEFQPEDKSVEHCSVTVQWDDGVQDENVETSKTEILLFDNSQKGIKQGAACDVCDTGYRIKGMRWKCTECPDYDLCTSCYMSAKDEHLDHKFQRITEPGERKKMETSRRDQEGKVKTALGIFKGAKVQELESSTEIKSTVEELWHNRVNNPRCIFVVNKANGKNQEIRGQFTDFQSDNYNNATFYYPSHLPGLGKYIQGYVKVEDESSKVEIVVELWYQKDVPKSSSYVKYSLYLIFALKPEDGENKFRPLEDVRKFASKSHLPCQLAFEKVLFLEEAVVIHKDTSNETIQKLVNDGVKKFARGEMEEGEDEQKYFQRMAVYVSGSVPLPVFISLRNGVINTDVLVTASMNKIPVISFKKKPRYVYVSTMKNDTGCVKPKEHKIDMRTPWKVIDMTVKEYGTGCSLEDEVSRLDDIPKHENMAALISNALIGVYMHNNSDEENNEENEIFGENSHIYPNALSVYLLRAGKWKIPKTCIKKSFNHRSIEFIFEEKLTKDFENGLWKEMELKTKSAYVVPTWIEQGTGRFEENISFVLRYKE
ncbi:uncharacterized protein LOC125661031 [Ostrea edulis]|uniref:uncharacterized protein LOC125661031 n=1 Tax=Ostrea edulis TaxID=37623 RepID=UPI0024AFA1C5|nr:uncharacterized protein LOC125661031 [Ostrea edulis]